MEARHVEVLAAFFDAVAGCDDSTALNDVFGAATRALGIKAYHYYVDPEPATGGHARTHCLSTFPAEWIDHWSAERYELIDAWTEATRNYNGPLAWSDVNKALILSNEQRRVMAEANEMGLVDGLNVPIHNGQATVFVSFATEPGQDASVFAKHHASLLSALAATFFFHPSLRATDRVTDQALANLDRRSRLSPREREVLQWIASGKTDWEVSRILHISERAVKFHVTGARKKLQATNRTHAVALAVSSRAITPR